MENSNLPEGLPEGAIPVVQSVGIASAPPNPTPDVLAKEPIIVTLPDGRKVGMAKPTMALSQFMAGVLKDVVCADPKLMQEQQFRVKSLLYITDIDGEQIDKIRSEIARCALEERLGDEACDLIALAWMTYFPPADSAQLVVSKK